MLRGVIRLAMIATLVGCGSTSRELPIIDVTGTDFAFQAPDSVAPGPTRIRFTRSGTVAHEVAIVRVKRGVSIALALETERKGGDVEQIYDVGDGLLYADVGERVDAELLVDFQPGRTYMLNCTLPGPGGTSHAMLGMLRPLYVRTR